MSGCLDNVRCDCGIEWREKRNTVSSIAAGVLFWSGWWIIISIAAIYPNDATAGDPKAFRHAYYTCGVFSTVSLIMINAVSNSQVRGEAMTEGVLGTRGARLWLLIGFVIGFGSLIASMWILFADFVVPGYSSQWRGVALFLQNFLIFLSSLLYKFGRTEDLWG